MTKDSSKKRRPIDKNVKNTIWKIHNGLTFSGECCVCGEPITIHNFEAGHIKAVANGGTDDISNLKPVCRSCNGSMGTMNLEEYKKKYFGKGTNSNPKPPKQENGLEFEIPEFKPPKFKPPKFF